MSGEQHVCGLCGAPWVGAHACSTPEFAGLVAMKAELAALRDFRDTCRKVVPIARLSDDGLEWLCPACGRAEDCEPDCWVGRFEEALHDADTATGGR